MKMIDIVETNNPIMKVFIIVIIKRRSHFMATIFEKSLNKSLIRAISKYSFHVIFLITFYPFK